MIMQAPDQHPIIMATKGSGVLANSVNTEAPATPWAGSVLDLGGVMSPGPAINPDFHTWNKCRYSACAAPRNA